LAEPIPALPPAPELEAQCALEYPTARQETIERVLEQLIGRLAERLIRCGRGAVRLRCRLECQSAGWREVSVGLFQATASARRLFALVRVQLERLALPAPVSAACVQATATAPLSSHQEALFPDGRAERHRRELADLIERLGSRLGCGAVLRPRLLSEAQPELAYRYDPLVGGLARTASRRGRSANRPACGPLLEGERDEPPRPLRVMAQPLPLAVISIVPEGPPLQFGFGNHSHHVARAWGPERIETGWWRGRGVGRDYYRIESASGQQFWVFRRRDDARWFVHGTFE
jgi:protein ImuB